MWSVPCSHCFALACHDRARALQQRLLLRCRLLIPKADFTRRYFAAHKTMARALVAACGLGGSRAAMVLDWQKVRLMHSSAATAGCAPAFLDVCSWTTCSTTTPA